MDDDNLFANSPHDGQTVEEMFNPTVDKEEEVEKPAESQTEKELADEAHFLKQNEAWEKMRLDKEALEARLEALEKTNVREEVEQPEFLTDMIGKNEDVARKWQEERQRIKEEAKQEIVQDQILAQQKEAETKEYWNKWTQDRFNEVEKEFKVDFKSDATLKNELAKVMTDYTPTDDQGNLDYRKGMKLLTDLKKSQAQEEQAKMQVKKTVADATVSRETSTKETKGYMTRNDLRGGWRSIVSRDN